MFKHHWIIPLVLSLTLATSVYAHDEDSFKGTEPTGPIKEVVKLSPEAQSSIGIKISEAENKSLPGKIVTQGEIEAIPTRTFIQHALLAGRVCSVNVELGDHVKANEIMAVLDSPEVNRLAAETLNTKTSIEMQLNKLKSQYAADKEQAAAKLSVISANKKRMETLYKEKIVAKKAMDSAVADYLVAKSHYKNLQKKEEVELEALKAKLKISLQSLTDRLRQVGIGESAITKMLKTNNTILKVPIRSSRPGVVTKILANPGESIDDQDPLFDVLDLSTVWANADIYESDMSRVSKGQSVLVKPVALPGTILNGKLSVIGSQVSAIKRTLSVKVEIKNADFKLKPEMYVDMMIETNESSKALILPRESVIERTGHFAVFSEVKPGVYQFTPVELGRSLGDNIEILSGIEPSTKVVTRGAFQLESHLLKNQGNTSQFSHPTEDHHHGHEHGKEGGAGHQHGEEISGSSWNPLHIVLLAGAFIFGGIVSAILIKSSNKNEDSQEDIDSAFEEAPQENRHD